MTAVTAAAVAVVVIGALAVTGWREHWPPAVFGQPARLALTWSPAEAPLPANAAGTASQSAGLNDVTCPSVQSCVTVGYYFTRDNPGENFGSTWGLIETLSHGTWTPAAAPVDVPFTQVTFFQLGGVTCRAAGTCVAVGSFGDTQNTERPLVETLSDGSWTPATPALPAGANQKAAFLSQVACPAPGTCVATGWYTAQNGASQGLIENTVERNLGSRHSTPARGRGAQQLIIEATDGPYCGKVPGGRYLRSNRGIHGPEWRHSGPDRHAVERNLDGGHGAPSGRPDSGQSERLSLGSRLPGARHLYGCRPLHGPERWKPGSDRHAVGRQVDPGQCALARRRCG